MNLNEYMLLLILILIDQILKNRFHSHNRILDAGCGEGRNMPFFINNGFNIYGIDINSDAIDMARLYCKSLNKKYEVEQIQKFAIEKNPFPEKFFDAIICINVLHSAKNRNDFFIWFEQLFRLLNYGGFLLFGMQSQIGTSKYHHQCDQKELVDLENENKYLLTQDVVDEILILDYLKTVENTKTILIDNEVSHTYLFLEKSV
jgi:2-polyprenyl-3-methyl-5-hydroxy-6-metoxy-1,4-benzoquinol methylase